MFHGVQARNQIFLGEFQLSDKVGCILAYPGSYPHTTSQCPSILVQYLPPHRSHWEKSIRLSLHGLFAPGLSAYPSYCHSNLVAKTRIANITNVMLHKQSNIFMMKIPSSKSALFSVWMAAKKHCKFCQSTKYNKSAWRWRWWWPWRWRWRWRWWWRWHWRWRWRWRCDDDTQLLIRGVCPWQDSCQGGGRSASGEAPSNILRYTNLRYIWLFKHS